jgi:hypothetical protein
VDPSFPPERLTTQVRIETTEIVVLPTGEYVAEVADIEESVGNFGPQLKWTFRILNSKDHSDCQVLGWTSTSPSTKGKLANWASACHARRIRGGETIDTHDLIGRRVSLVLTVEENGEGAEFNKIQTLKPYKKSQPAGDGEADDDEDGPDPFVRR